MAILRIDHVQLAMPPGNEEEARAFYGGLLGFRETPKPEHLEVRGGCWFESGSTSGSVRVHFGVERDFAPARKAHPAFIVDNLRALILLLQSNGYPLTEDQQLEGFDRVYVNDPFGNRIELMQPID